MQQLADQANLVVFIVSGIALLVIALLFLSSYASLRELRRQMHAPIRKSVDVRRAAYRPATVLQVLDGETVAVSDSGRRVTLRLDSISCQHAGEDPDLSVRGGLIGLIGSRDIVYETHSTNGQGHVLATLFVVQQGSWINVNARLVKLGYARVKRVAWLHLSRERRDELDRMEHWAKSYGLGLWAAE